MNPIKKVKARRCQPISELDEENFISQPLQAHPTKVLGVGVQSPIGAHPPITNREKNVCGSKFSPVGCINLPDSPCAQVCTSNFKIKRVSFEQPGSKQAPILVAEASPKPPMPPTKDCTLSNIQTVGSNEFRRRCCELLMKTDATYNKLLAEKLGANCGADPQDDPPIEDPNPNDPTAHLARRKHMFVNLMMAGQSPPLQENTRFPVSDVDIIHYSAIIELGHCTAHEVRYFEKQPVSSGRHYFFPHIRDALLKYQSVPDEVLMRTTFEGPAKASKSRNLGHRDNKLFVFLDSYHDKCSNFHIRKKDLLTDNFTHLLGIYFWPKENFRVFRSMYPHVPKQDNLLDCDVF
ncbi:unnamed protein product [Alopecurus aequalis]